MEENTELEEVEACYNKDRHDNIDLDSLSYIDERIQHVLGHFQKDFEGGVSAENLGAKFGGYGSFLPAYECSPSRSHPKASQKNYMSSKSPCNHYVEAAPDNLTSPSHVPPSTRLGNTRAFSVDDSMNKVVGISSNIGAEMCSLNNHCTIKSGKSTEQRTLKFRIKMKSDNLAQKNAAIYSGLGLDISPSSSMDNSPIVTGGMPPVSQHTDEESPTGIIQAMSSFPIPGGVLISPLRDSMLYLTRREKVHGDRKSLSALNGQEPCSMSTDESDSTMGGEDLLKKKKERMLHPKKTLGNKTAERKDFLFNDLKGTPLFSSSCDAGETSEVIGGAFEVSKKVSKDGANGRMVSTEAVKEELLESMSGQDFDKSDKNHVGNGSMQRIIECKLGNSLKSNSVGPEYNSQGECSINSQKAEVDVIKCFGDDSQQVETTRKGKPLSDGKHKSKGDQSPSKAVAIAKKDSFKASNNEVVNDKKISGFGDSKSKTAITKSSRDNNVVGISARSLKRDELECRINGTDPVYVSMYDNFTDGSTYGVKIKERQSSDKTEKLISGPGIKNALNACPIAENKSAPEMVQMAATSQLIEENWVCCDRCQKWRLLPVGIKPEQLPEKWLCSMLNWLPGMNRCDISEEMTTKALYASCQLPTSGGLNNFTSNAFGSAIGAGSADAQQLGLSHQNFSSGALSDHRKKKLGPKEKKSAEICTDNLLSSDSTQNHAEESGKIPSHQHPAEENRMRKPVSQQCSKLNNLMEVKHMSKEKEKKMNGGDGKQGKLKHKVDADKCQPRTLKKPKLEDIDIADTQLNPGMDLEKVARNSGNGFPAKASGEDIWKYDEYCLSEDVQDKIVGPVKKQDDQIQVLSDGGSLDLKSHSKKGSSFKKRKLEDWQDADKLHKMSLKGDKKYGKGSSSGFRKEKKFRVLNPEAKSFAESEYKINEKGEMNQGFLSGGENFAAVGAEVGSVDKVYPQRNHIEKVASHKVLDDADPLGMDLGSGLLSLAATSSSSKVSGSHKCRINYANMKGSPVESVTSSPLRIPHDREGKLSVKVKERVSCNLHSESLKFASIWSRVEDAKDKAGVQGKTSKARDNHLLNFDVATVQQNGDCANYESRVNKCNQESALSLEKSGKVTSLGGKEKGKRSGSEVDRNKAKISASENGYMKNGGRQESAVEPNYDAFSHGSKNSAQCSFPKSKCEVKKNSVRRCPREIGKQTELRQNDSQKSAPKVDASFSTSKEILSQENRIQGLEDRNNAVTVCTESQDGESKVLLSSVGEEKRETRSGSRNACESKKGDTCIEHLIHASIDDDVGKLMKISAGTSCKGGVNCSSGTSGPDRQLPVTTPVRKTSSQTAYDTLKEASNLKDRADHFKNSGFEFESNETFFEAALKFLHGASLLENFDKESGKHGNISQMQAYTTAAKLFSSCAHEYERHKEMAAAVLAYKCMEVAYMRLVYSKHSSINRDLHELQSTLQMVPQGESPSSSASDVDNLNNQAVVGKFTLARGTGTHVAGNQVISARHRSNFARLLDFTQDVNYAMEASRKCQSSFAAANMIMEEARNVDCITSMRRIINLSFQDVDELVGLVCTANKALSHAHLSGARE